MLFRSIFFEEQANPRVAETVAHATGAKVSVLWTIGRLTEEQIANKSDYISIMRENLAALKEALE